MLSPAALIRRNMTTLLRNLSSFPESGLRMTLVYALLAMAFLPVESAWGRNNLRHRSRLVASELVSWEAESDTAANSPREEGTDRRAPHRADVRSPESAPWLSWQSLLGIAALALGLVAAGLLARLRGARALREANEALRQSEERLQLALWGGGDWLWDWDIPKNQVFRTGMFELLGYKAHEAPTDFDEVEKLVHPEDRSRLAESVSAHLAGQTDSYVAEYRLRAKGGGWRWVHDQGKVVARDEVGRPARMAGTWRDVTEAKQAELELRLAAMVTENSTEAIVVLDLAFTIVKVNRAFVEITGFSPEEAQGRPASMLKSERQQGAFYRAVEETVRERGHWRGEIWAQRKDGELFLGYFNISAVAGAGGEPVNFVGVFSDITRHKRSEEELQFLANYDPLTGLPNRALFHDRLGHALESARRQACRVAVLFVDIDRFKRINDTLGHALGDLLIKAAAKRLQRCLQQSDTIARFGGDEFTVILEEVRHRRDVQRAALSVQAAFQEPFRLEGHELSVSCSIGVSLFRLGRFG